MDASNPMALDIINLNKYEKGVGPLFACQVSIVLFIERCNPTYTETLYEWLGLVECSIDELCEKSYDRSLFILKTLEKYKMNTRDSNLLLNYGDAMMGSLQFQIKMASIELCCCHTGSLYKSR